jgi:hypothetical protein
VRRLLTQEAGARWPLVQGATPPPPPPLPPPAAQGGSLGARAPSPQLQLLRASRMRFVSQARSCIQSSAGGSLVPSYPASEGLNTVQAYRPPESVAVTTIVNTHAQPTFRNSRQFTPPLAPSSMPTPTVAPTWQCVVLSGRPMTEPRMTMVAELSSMVNPRAGVTWQRVQQQHRTDPD